MFSLFSAYPTFMIFLGVAIAMVITMVLMPAWIRFLKTSHIGQQVRADGPQSHLVKQGTPTMGGVIMLIAVIVFTLLASVGAPTAELWLLLGATVATGILGLIDDASKVAHERSLGLTPKAKLIGQFLIAAVFVLVAVNLLGIKPTVEIPFVATLDLGVLTTVVPVGDGIAIPWLYLIYCLILLVGLCNAVNLTDGLDGLAAGTVMVVMLVMAAIAFRAGVLEPALFAGALAGACIGFLWFNSHPADIFMGDTGSLALGMALGCLAVVTKTEFVVIIIGGLFVAEALSVMIQVFYYKKTKKRIFLMAPLHHHFEKKGWSETKVVVRFWIVSGMLAACGFVLYFRLLAAGCGALLPQPWAALPAMLLEVCSGCDQAARTGLWASTLCCAALSVQGVSVLLQVRTICPAEISLRPLLAARAVHLPLSVALFWLGSTVPVQAVQTFTTLTERVVVLRRVPLDCALLAFAVCCITVEELARS